MIVECSHHESVARQGRIRTQGYLMRQLGTVVGGVMGAVLYNTESDGGDWAWGLSIAQVSGRGDGYHCPPLSTTYHCPPLPIAKI